MYSLRTSFSYVVWPGSAMSGIANGRLLVLTSTLDGESILVVQMLVTPRPDFVCFVVGSGGIAVAGKATGGFERQRNGLCVGKYRLCRAGAAVRRRAKPNAAARFIEHFSGGGALVVRMIRPRNTTLR